MSNLHIVQRLSHVRSCLHLSNMLFTEWFVAAQQFEIDGFSLEAYTVPGNRGGSYISTFLYSPYRLSSILN